MAANIYIDIDSGMGNRILPLISAIRISQIKKIKLFVHWSGLARGRFVETKDVSLWAGRMHKISDFFKEYDHLFTTISSQDLLVAKRHSKCKCFQNTSVTTCVITQKDIDNYEVLWFNRIWFPLMLDRDDCAKFVPYPTSLSPLLPNEYVNELRKYAKLLIINDEINTKVDECKKLFKKKMLGVHIRSTNGGFKKKTFGHLQTTIQNFLNSNSDYGIFLAADTNRLEDEYKQQFKDKVIVYKTPIDGYKHKRSNTVAGVQNGIVDMLLLSNCDCVLGTGESSFSFMSFIFGEQSEYKVHTA